MELAASARSMAGWQPNTVPATQLKLDAFTPETRCCRVCGESRQALTMGMLCWSCHTATPEWAAQEAKTQALIDRLQERKVAG